jgi:hypothetical protein
MFLEAQANHINLFNRRNRVEKEMQPLRETPKTGQGRKEMNVLSSNLPS